MRPSDAFCWTGKLEVLRRHPLRDEEKAVWSMEKVYAPGMRPGQETHTLRSQLAIGIGHGKSSVTLTSVNLVEWWKEDVGGMGC